MLRLGLSYLLCLQFNKYFVANWRIPAKASSPKETGAEENRANMREEVETESREKKMEKKEKKI